MKYTTYSRYVPGLLETLNLQALLDQLADFLLQSGFAGGSYSHPFWGEFGEEDPDRLVAPFDTEPEIDGVAREQRGQHYARGQPTGNNRPCH